jgi:hypothetical protein
LNVRKCGLHVESGACSRCGREKISPARDPVTKLSRTRCSFLAAVTVFFLAWKRAMEHITANT